jgi:magnesium transporter
MIRSFSFTTQGRLHARDMETFLMPTLLADTHLFLWVDLEASSPEEARRILEGVFHFHPLSINDCIGVSASPRVEVYEPSESDRFTPYLFMVIHAVDYSRKDGIFATSELNFFLGRNFLVTYHPLPLRSIQLTQDRCLHGSTPIGRAPDRVAHALLDALVDNYDPALEELSLEISDLEEEVFRRPDAHVLNRILRVKKEVLHLRQIIGPQREVLGRFARGDFKLIRGHLIPYYRDVFNGLNRITEHAQSQNDTLSGLLQIYLNLSANRTADVVKVLTIFTVMTTPLMVIGTWYGMNFDGMPELGWDLGYEAAIALTVVTTGFSYLYFRRKGWL